MSYYRSDLAAIHERGFAHLANAAADVLTAKLDLPQSLTRVMANCLGGGGGTPTRRE